MQRAGRAEPSGVGQQEVVQVHGDDRPHRAPQHRDDQRTDRSRADHERPSARDGTGAGDGVAGHRRG